ncbi:Metallo-hydrolase/oxidoreductase [Hortaea werneckii]|nr:Metallo-hydrolase/oxidoreductase [Hortaea werneckii]KAI6880285.1 Metallo-hydrolase/oxidoreductase [Hortaea werneckii]KAI6989504.1 Metallo-hydrolase/oxidoreductase [Hortaea werneckii]KAI7142190.1 Metallo-hydrolase/oxidoreductase [Hortaea werneckii]KAI7169554.1 Metallo-hydrolase/oxidoreductase [Hortaea werneckii]
MASSITVRPLPPVRKQQQQQQQQGDNKTKETNDEEDDPSATKAHHRPGGGFQNPWNSFKHHSLSEALRLRFGSHPEKNFVPVPQGPDGARSGELVKVQKPDWGVERGEKLRATWIGHASFLVEFPVAAAAAVEGTGGAEQQQQQQQRGIRVLCDPVFSERTSPFQWLGPKRYTPTPCSLEELPEVDVVCISHNHYDHLDYATVQHIYDRQGRKVHFVAGLGNKKWFTQQVGCQEDEVSELDWWDACEVEVKGLGKVRLTCCPTQHGSGRSINDQGQTLWCSWAIESNGKKLYFAGDTAYKAEDAPAACPAFQEIGESLGPFDLALLPIGLMSPHQWMGSVHATPEQSLQIHKDVKSKLSIGMHWGTVRGGISAHYEDVRDPPRRWQAAAEKEGLWRGGGPQGTPLQTEDTESGRSEYGGVGLCEVGETVAV